MAVWATMIIHLVFLVIHQSVHPQLILDNAVGRLPVHQLAKVRLCPAVHREADDCAMAAGGLLGDVYEGHLHGCKHGVLQSMLEVPLSQHAW